MQTAKIIFVGALMAMTGIITVDALLYCSAFPDTGFTEALVAIFTGA